MKAFANKIREILSEKQITQKELAQKLFMSYSSFNNKMNCYNSFTLEEFLAICEFLSLSPNEALGYSDDVSRLYHQLMSLNRQQRAIISDLVSMLLDKK